MRTISRALFLVVLVAASAAPLIAGETCEACGGYYDPSTCTSEVFCVRAIDGEMGSFDCTVECSDGFCYCYSDGPPVYCMTIVVSG